MINNKCLIIIPAWNEEKALPVAISDLKKQQPDLDVLVIDDGSRDSTSAVAKALGCNVVPLPLNLGIGGAVQTGLLYAYRNHYGYAIQFDADGQHLASEINKILDPVRNGHSDAVIGSRFLTSDGFKSSAARRMGISILRFVISTAIRQKITDATSGFRAYNREAISFLASEYPCDYPEAEAIVLLYKHGYKVKESAVKMRERQAGKSSIGTLHSGYYMVKVLLAIFMMLLRDGVDRKCNL